VDFVEVAGESVTARSLKVVLADSTDLPFLEVAASGHADALVTGNAKHFMPRRGKHNVIVLTPAEFVARLSDKVE
jgi:predicted nucleic acid-binding protein